MVVWIERRLTDRPFDIWFDKDSMTICPVEDVRLIACK
jgi:hypothetical protein